MRTSNWEESERFRLWLQSEYADRSKNNPSYSLRAFSNLLQMDSSSLSQILAGKRAVSRTVIDRVCDILKPAPKQFSQPSTPIKREKKLLKPDYRQIGLDAFAIMSDWHHYAILELTYVKDFESNPAWIAQKLSLNITEVKSAIERLLRLELLEEIDGRLRKTNISLTNESDKGISGPALKELQRQVLRKALEAIENTPQEEKDITSMTMSIDERKLPQARAIIKKFRRDICEFLEDGTQTRVYNLGIQLYPISKPVKK